MFLRDGIVVTSASDLSLASACEYAFSRKLDEKLRRIERLDVERDPMLVRASELGDVHEATTLQRYRDAFGVPGEDRRGGVVEIAQPDLRIDGALDEAVARTRQAFADGADVVFQATFARIDAQDAFLGYADFVVRGADSRYVVQDTKLARSAKVTALLQLAAYADQLHQDGIAVADRAELLLGDGVVSTHRLADVLPVFRNRWRRMRRLIELRSQDDAPTAWGATGLTVCGRCDHCQAAIAAHRDVLQVAGMRVLQRGRLAAAGIDTIDALAASIGPVDGIGGGALQALRTQARLQLRSAADGPPAVEPVDLSVLAAVPTPDDGDVFFDFEGDPLHNEGGEQWGLDYLFGLVDQNAEFSAWWAHDFAEERQALVEFLAFVRDRRARFPGMHVYHYASYEKTHLLSLAARHGVGEDEVDDLLREHVLVDLYPIVRKALRIGSDSYSIKRLEPLYMGDDLRTADVADGADSITAYVEARRLARSGQLVEGQTMLDQIAAYNDYDCRSTLRLRDWLLERAREGGVVPETPDVAEEADDGGLAPSPVRDALLARAGDPLDPERDADADAAGLAAAALDYHRRERKTFWQGHFSRLVDPVEEWADTKDVLVVDGAVVARDWFREGRQRTDRRELHLRGTLAPGSSLKPGSEPYVLYGPDGPRLQDDAAPGARQSRKVQVTDVRDDGTFFVVETQPKDVPAWSALPIALTPPAPISPGAQQGAIEDWAATVAAAQPAWPTDAITDVLRRRPPRTTSGGLAPVAEDGSDRQAAMVASLLDLDGSWLAVQGPPGTGKTYLGSRVIAELVTRHGWKVGVVAQSHAVVENFLGAVVRAGLDTALVGKAAGRDGKTGDEPFTVLGKGGPAAFCAEHAATGFVVGGTAWTFANANHVTRGELDLLVVDEAGQFSLAATIASSVAARNLLLLGDPQQLPQVSQGSHPEPVDESALGWISAGHDVLPADLGYFLAESHRMHPTVTAPVSRLAYAGKLRSHPRAAERRLDGIDPGLHVAPVRHVGNANASPEEAAEVVRLVESALGAAWDDGGGDVRPLGQDDVIVVTPYNAQRELVQDALTAAGHGDVPVGTVDKFQGQEAAIAIVTLAASSAADVPRGLSFLIMKNRLNVAISRAQWAAWLICSPDLVEHLPPTPAGVAELSAFLTLLEAGEG